ARIPRAGGDSRLGGVVDHERHIAVSSHRLQRGRQLTCAYEQVVHEARLADRGDAALDVVAQKPARVGFVVDLVPHSDQQVADQGGDRLRDRRRGQVDPADDAADEIVGRRRLEKLARLVEAGYRLDQDGLLDAVVVQLPPQV